MPYTGYPPTHRDHRQPQPETCELCGLYVQAADLQLQDIDGLRGHRICHVHEPWRGRPTGRDRERMHPGVPGPKFVGQGRVFEPGDAHWWLMDPDRSATAGDPMTDDFGTELTTDAGVVWLEDFEEIEV